MDKKNEMQKALGSLKVVSIGTAVAEIMKNKLIPEHSLALSTALRKENVNRHSVDHQQALNYLRKNQTTWATDRRGFALMEFEGLGLGWVNILQNRVNNLYPTAWRIRMQG